MSRVQDKANELREKAHWHIAKARKLLERADRLSPPKEKEPI